ncbi:MAG TPA: GNAT family N-acetyltransferase [Candidatus Anaerostipes avistercoris]|uniref:GNAT family N-acetyltransferase n=1 Tax=Candidatus Anaerostipes avistercoris TaxID=2838462 RepID=A0A9D2T856_9FIRM|nr:GNAT family N-acetyltransferase [Candidatus Anaerostipes avistercoris]
MKNEILLLDEKSVNDFWRLRIELFQELEEVSKDADCTQLESATKQYYVSHINKDLISWGVFQEGQLAATGSLCLFTRIPYNENLSGLEGYILNIYTSKQFRGNGFANQILDNMIEYSYKNNIKRLWLNSSEQGKHLYTKKGFIQKNNEMELFL